MKDDRDALLGKALSGELEPAERDRLDCAFAEDAGLADELARDARLGALLSIALEKDDRFERALRERHRAGSEQAPFVDALRRRARRPPAAWLAGAAAAAFLGLLLWAVLRPVPPAAPEAPAEAPRSVLRSYPAARDATIYGARPDQNYGANGRLEAGGHALAALLGWDLSEIPPGSRIESATLILGDARNFGTGASLRLTDVPHGWVETQATWKASARGVPWPKPGARSAHDRAEVAVGSLAPADGHRGVATIDVAIVQRWVDDPARNHGLLLASDTVRDWTAGFASREAPDPSTHPALVLRWIPATRK